MKKLNRKKTPIILVAFLVVILGGYISFFSNRPRNLNVLLITIDSLRPDHLGCYGYKRNTSPNIDKLAKEGVLFTQAISQSSATISSLPSLMTSTYPDVHKVKEWGDSIDESLFTLAQVLKNYGFYTGAICAHDFFVSLPGLSKGFDTLSTGVDLLAEDITEQAILWLEKNRNRKFLLWLHYFDPHEPYRPSTHIKVEPENIKIENDNKQVPILEIRPSDPDIYGGLGGIPDYAIINGRRDRGYYISLYDGEIKYVDEQIGILLEKWRLLV